MPRYVLTFLHLTQLSQLLHLGEGFWVEWCSSGEKQVVNMLRPGITSRMGIKRWLVAASVVLSLRFGGVNNLTGVKTRCADKSTTKYNTNTHTMAEATENPHPEGLPKTNVTKNLTAHLVSLPRAYILTFTQTQANEELCLCICKVLVIKSEHKIKAK